MCLAVPGRILSVEEHGISRVARAEFGGIVRETLLDFVPEAEVGDYVLVHVGFAISVVDAEEANRTLDLLSEVGLFEKEPSAASESDLDP
jgi:hydrogenase expression/formation protein HypC